MNIGGITAVVTGGGSGLGRACAEKLVNLGASVVIADLPTSDGETVARSMGPNVRFVAADVRSEQEMLSVFEAAEATGNPTRAIVHCAGRGGPLRILDKDGNPGSYDLYKMIVDINLVGTFNVLRLGAAAIARQPLTDEGERGVIVLTASVAAYEGQIGQVPYASSKAGVVGMTIVAARDLASRAIRVCTIAPGQFDTPLLARLSPQVRASLASSSPHPRRLGEPSEFAGLAAHIIENPMLNGETIRLDAALRMPPR